MMPGLNAMSVCLITVKNGGNDFASKKFVSWALVELMDKKCPVSELISNT